MLADYKNIGLKFMTNEGYEVEIIECNTNKNYTVRFTENLHVVKSIQFINIKRGRVANPYHRSVYEIGYIGVGKYSGKTHPKAKTKWNSMFVRCYDKNFHKNNPTYIDCSVCEEWKCFQVFAEWFEENYVEDWQLDKDLKIKGSRVYSPETCWFLPREINMLFNTRKDNKEFKGVYKLKNKFRAVFEKVTIGYSTTAEGAFEIYKIAKRNSVEQILNKWRNKIPDEMYQILITYNL